MAKVKGESYQYYVEAQDGSVPMIDFLNAEGVQPGEVLRLVIRGIRGNGILSLDRDVLLTRTGQNSYTAQQSYSNVA